MFFEGGEFKVFIYVFFGAKTVAEEICDFILDASDF